MFKMLRSSDPETSTENYWATPDARKYQFTFNSDHSVSFHGDNHC